MVYRQSCTCGHRWEAFVSVSSCPSCGAAVSGTRDTNSDAAVNVTSPPALPVPGTLLTTGAIRQHQPTTGSDTPVNEATASSRVVSQMPPGFEMEGELGRGGMGIVYKARQIALKRTVALKMILAAEHAAPQEMARFHREAEAVARMQHPNIVQIHEVGTHENRPFFAMEFVEGGTLAKQLDGVPWVAARAAGMVATLARAVHHAHQAGIVHRDLKPANVLMTADGHPKISDFGLAKHMDADQDLSRSGAVMGTPSYMAPEQAEGRVREIGPTADVYALGAILYELLTGRPPFRGATVLDTLEQVRTREPVLLSQLNPKLPADAETICLKCLRKEPANRYASADELADDLGRFLRGEPIRARPVGRLERGWRWCRRNPAAAGLLASLLVGATVATFFGVQASRRADDATKARDDFRLKAADEARERRAAEEARGTAEREKGRADRKADDEKEARLHEAQEKERAQRQLLRAEALLYGSHIELAMRSWDENQPRAALDALEACRPDFRGWEFDYLQSFFEKNRRTFRGFALGAHCVRFSPDGRRVAAGGLNTGVRIWDILSEREPLLLTRQVIADPGEAKEDFSAGAGTVEKLAFSSDGKTLVTVTSNGTVTAWDAATGADRWRAVADLGDKNQSSRLEAIYDLKISHDSKFIALARYVSEKTGELRVLEAATGRLAFTVPVQDESSFFVAFSRDGKHLLYSLGSKNLKVYDLATRKDVSILPRQTFPDLIEAIDPNGQRLATLGEGGRSYEIWDLETGKVLLRLSGPGKDLHVRPWFNADGTLFAFNYGSQFMVCELKPDGVDRNFRGHSRIVMDLDFSSDNGLVATASEDGTVKVWEIGARRSDLVFPMKGNARGLCFSPDGRRLATTGGLGYGGLNIFNSQTGKDLEAGNGGLAPIQMKLANGSAVCFSPDGPLLAWAGADKNVRLFDTATGQEKPALAGHDKSVHSIAFSPNGRILASGGEDGMILFWDVGTGQVARTLERHTKSVTAVRFSPDGRLLASASDDRTVRLWDAASGKEVHCLHGHTYPIKCLEFLPGGRQLLSGSRESADPFLLSFKNAGYQRPRLGELRLWDVLKGAEIDSFETQAPGITGLTCHPDGDRVAVGHLDGSVTFRDTRSGVVMWRRPTGDVDGLAFSPDGRRLAVAAGGQFSVWELASEKRPRVSKIPSAVPRTGGFTAEGGLRLAGGMLTLRVWDASTTQETCTITGPREDVLGLTFDPGARRLAGGTGAVVKLWDAVKGSEVLSCPGHEGRVACTAFNSPGTLLVSGAADRTVRVWETATGRQTLVLRGHEHPVYLVAFSPDGKHIASLAGPEPKDSDDIEYLIAPSEFKMWDAITGNEKWSLKMPGRLPMVAFAPNGKHLAGRDPSNGNLTMWDVDSGRVSLSREWNDVDLRTLAFSPDGRFLATAGFMEDVRLYDARTGEFVRAFHGHTELVQKVFFSPDSQRLVSLSADQMVRIWDVPSVPVKKP